MKTFGLIILILLLTGFFLAGCSKDSDQTVEKLNAEALKLVQAGQVGQALKMATLAVEKAEKENGAEHPAVAGSLETLGLVYQAMEDAEKAELTHLRALSIVKKSIGPDSEEAAKIMNNLAGLYYTKKQNAEAASFYKQAMAIVEKKFPADDPRLVVLKKNIAVCEGKETKVAEDPASEMSTSAEQAHAAMTNPPVNMVQDLVPKEIKDSMTKQLADQNIFISDLEPRQPVMIEGKGVVFPYHGLKKGKDSESAQEIIILFAAVSNPEKPNAVIFQQCRLISHTSYQAALEKGGTAQLKKEIEEVFSKLYL
jgi:tetratricopeptide (TPR) repeat protein